MNPSGYGSQGHSHLPQYSQPSSNLQHLPHAPKHPQTQPHSQLSYGPHSQSSSGYQYPSPRQTHPGSYRTTSSDYVMGGTSDLSHKRKLETISQQDQKRPRLSSTQQTPTAVIGPGGAGSMTPSKSEGESKEEREGEKWDVMQVMGLPKFLSETSTRKGNDLKDIPVATNAPDPEARKAFVDKTALGQKMRLITHEFKMQVDDKTLQLVHDALLFALRDILDGLITLYPSPRVYTVEDLLLSLERNVYIHRKARDFVMRPPKPPTEQPQETTQEEEEEEEEKPEKKEEAQQQQS